LPELLAKLEKIILKDLPAHEESMREQLNEFYHDVSLGNDIKLRNDENMQATKKFSDMLSKEADLLIPAIRKKVDSTTTKEKVHLFIENTFAALNTLLKANNSATENFLDFVREHEVANKIRFAEHTVWLIYDHANTTLESLIQFLDDYYPSYLLAAPKKSDELKNELAYLESLFFGKLQEYIYNEYRYGKTAQDFSFRKDWREEFISKEIRSHFETILENEPTRIITALKQNVLSLTEEQKKIYLQSHYDYVNVYLLDDDSNLMDEKELNPKGDIETSDYYAVYQMIYSCFENTKIQIEAFFGMYLNEKPMQELEKLKQKRSSKKAKPITRVKTNLSISQLGFLFRMFREAKCMQFKSDVSAAEFAAKYFTAETTTKPSKNQVRKKSYDISKEEYDKLNDLLVDLRNTILPVLYNRTNKKKK